MKGQKYQFEKRILKTSQVFDLIDRAVVDNKGFSLARLGIGEISYLSWPENPWLVQDFKKYERYAGVSSSSKIIKGKLVTSLKQADIVGVISPSRLEFWGKQTRRVFQQLNYIPAACCCAWIFQDCINQNDLWPWLIKRRIIVIGRRAKEARELFMTQGVEVVSTIEVNSDIEIDEVIKSVSSLGGWDVALISAGIPGTILAPKIANSFNKVAIDFGHSLDILIEGKEFDHSKTVSDWNKRND